MIIKGEKVVLRPVRMEDAPRFVKWFNDPAVNKFLNYRKLTLSEEKQRIKEKLTEKSGDAIFFCIDTVAGEHIGATSLDGINYDQRRASFGIIIGEKIYWNKGCGTEASQLILEYGFVKLKLHRIELDVYDYNPRAIKVYKRLGFKVEGKKREHAEWKGKFYNALLMGMLEKEWQKRNKSLVMQWE